LATRSSWVAATGAELASAPAEIECPDENAAKWPAMKLLKLLSGVRTLPSDPANGPVGAAARAAGSYSDLEQISLWLNRGDSEGFVNERVYPH